MTPAPRPVTDFDFPNVDSASLDRFMHRVSDVLATAPTAAVAARAIYAACVRAASEEGQKPDVEVDLRQPTKARPYWHVSWEAGPTDWAVYATLDALNPRILAEPYYGFDLEIRDITA
jgi:hypothetical protein